MGEALNLPDVLRGGKKIRYPSAIFEVRLNGRGSTGGIDATINLAIPLVVEGVKVCVGRIAHEGVKITGYWSQGQRNPCLLTSNGWEGISSDGVDISSISEWNENR